MFNPTASFVVEGAALGLNISVRISVEAPGADASALQSAGSEPLITDVQNIQTLLVSAINGALIRIQHMHTHIDGTSINDLRVGRAAQPQSEGTKLEQFLKDVEIKGKPQ